MVRGGPTCVDRIRILFGVENPSESALIGAIALMETLLAFMESASSLGMGGLMPIRVDSCSICVLPSPGAASFGVRNGPLSLGNLVLDGLGGDGLVANRLYLHRSWFFRLR